MFNLVDRNYTQPRPIKRKRVGVACKTCRSHKIRCDGARPLCGTCQRRRESCVYDDENARNNQRTDLSTGTKSLGNNNPGTRDFLLGKPIIEDDSSVTAMGLVSCPLTNKQRSTGGFFGDSSMIAFIRQLQDTVRLRTTAPEPLQEFSIQESSRVLNEIDDPRALLPPRHLADHLVDCYFAKIHTLYPFVHREVFLAAYQGLWREQGSSLTERPTNGLGLGDTKGTRKTFYYGLNVVFALGCQFSDVIQVEREATSEAFFHACKPALDVDYLEAGDLALTQTVLLMAHYLQGSRAPNRCWHVSGMACRLAQGVGLHVDAGNEHRSFAEIQIRRRVWHGCVMLDLAISFILGRPVMVSDNQCTPLPLPIDDRFLVVESLVCEQPPGVFSRVEWFIATRKLYELVRKTLNTLYDNAGKECEDDLLDQKQNKRLFQIQCITQIDSELQDFRHRTPGPLRWDVPVPEGQQSEFLRERYLLKARFLYLRLLIYRPILSQLLHEILSCTGTESERQPGRSGSGIYENFSMDCSVFCVQSAIDLISLIHESCNTDLASVWFYNVFYIFTAGSITLLAEIHQPIVHIVTGEALETSWDKCRATLAHLKSYSVVAERCADSMATIRSKCLASGPKQVERPQDSNEQPGLASDSAGLMTFSGDLFRDVDFDFDEQTFFDPFWFNLEQ